MITSKNALVVVGIVAFLILAGIAWNYTETIKTQTALERQKLQQDADFKQRQLDQEKELEVQKNYNDFSLKQAELNRNLESDCQKQIASLRLRYNNVEGGGYNTYYEYCEVSYKDTKTGEIKKSDIKDMISAK